MPKRSRLPAPAPPAHPPPAHLAAMAPAQPAHPPPADLRSTSIEEALGSAPWRAPSYGALLDGA
eukprot:710023-Heterocapsa_arctica.AAC.1